MIKVVIYARYSCDHQREESIEGQLRECQEFCSKNDFLIINNYIDRATSAKTDNRPEFQRMIKDSNKKEFERVVVWKLDRFSRNRYDAAKYKNVLNKNGVKVISATENISDTPEGVILESVLEGFAEYYSKDLAQKVTRGMTENLLKGKFNGGRLPYGIGVIDGKYTIIEEEAILIKKIFNEYVSTNKSINMIVKEINNEGYRNRKGQPFNQGTVSDYLSNRKYIGEITFKDKINKDALPPIIDINVFNQAQEKKRINAISSGCYNATEKYLLTNKLFCGECGKKMVGDSTKKKNGTIYRWYKCSDQKHKGKVAKDKCDIIPINKNKIENIVLKVLVALILESVTFEKIIDKIIEFTSRENPEIPKIQESIQTIDKKISNLIKAISDGAPYEAVKIELDTLNKNKKELEQRLAKEKLSAKAIDKDFIIFYFEKFFKDKVKRDEDFMSRVFVALLNKVTIFKNGKIEIVLNFSDRKVLFDLNKEGPRLMNLVAPIRLYPNLYIDYGVIIIEDNVRYHKKKKKAKAGK